MGVGDQVEGLPTDGEVQALQRSILSSCNFEETCSADLLRTDQAGQGMEMVRTSGGIKYAACLRDIGGIRVRCNQDQGCASVHNSCQIMSTSDGIARIAKMPLTRASTQKCGGQAVSYFLVDTPIQTSRCDCTYWGICDGPSVFGSIAKGN